MTEIHVNNFFNTTDISIYEAWFQDGIWRKGDLVIDRMKGGQDQNVDVKSNGIYVTFWKTVDVEIPIGKGYLKIPGASTVLDVYDIRAGHMPEGFYANWRGLHMS